MKFYDIVIIGAGAVGNAIARELSKYELNICVLEKELDVAFGTSGRNSGVLHAGFNNKPGTLMAELCVKGSQGFAEEADSLGISFNRTGKLVTALFEEDIPSLEKLKKQGEMNGAKGLSIIDQSQIQKINPKIQGIAALWSKDTGVFDPFEYTIALAEEAKLNGATYYFNYQVEQIQSLDEEYPFYIKAKDAAKAGIKAKYVINSAGLFSDKVCRLLGIDDYIIKPCRGEYHILDKKVSEELSIPVYPVPNERAGGLGVHLTPTIHGNLMIGPSAEYIDEYDDYSSTADVMEQLFVQGRELFPYIKSSNIIRSFSGIRPKLTSREQGGYADFVIEERSDVPGFIILTGIESPGLTASIPIAKKIVAMISDKLVLTEKSNYRERSLKVNQSNDGSQRVVCRCENKTEVDILKAYDDIIQLRAMPTMKGIKNRTRAGMGNCQGSFCSVQIIDLLMKKRNINPLRFWNDVEDSYLFVGRTR